jgi:serralysin
MGLAASLSAPAGAAFHLFRINEIYSSADGTVQFIELKESTGSNFESFWQGQTLTSMQGATTRTFTFPTDLPNTQTASRSVLIATPAFAALAGVTPDFVVPAPFLFPGGGAINYAGVDSVAYDPLPTDGITSINRNGVQALSSPTNFAGQTGSLIAPIPPSVVAANSIPVVGTVGLTLLALLVTLGAWHARPGVVKKR